MPSTFLHDTLVSVNADLPVWITVYLPPEVCPQSAIEELTLWCLVEFGYCPPHIGRGTLGVVMFAFRDPREAVAFVAHSENMVELSDC